MSFVGIILILLSLAGCKTAEAPYTASVTPMHGVYHYVRTGETLWSISNRYNVDINTLVKANHLGDVCGDIRIGQRLLIPGATKLEPAPIAYTPGQGFRWPLNGQVVSCFGAKMDRARNKGIDIRGREGSVVKASRAGKVVFCDEWLKGFGKTIILDHGDSFQTVYAYNSALLVRPGDMVEQDTAIARIGRSGRAKEPSLHFEIRRNGEPQNPYYYLSR